MICMIIVKHGCLIFYQPKMTDFYDFCYVRLHLTDSQTAGELQALLLIRADRDVDFGNQKGHFRLPSIPEADGE